MIDGGNDTAEFLTLPASPFLSFRDRRKVLDSSTSRSELSS